ISKKYFYSPVVDKTYTLFFNNIKILINSFTNDSYAKYSRKDEFKRELFRELKKINARIIPEIDFSDEKELVYRKRVETNVKLPEDIEISLTDFEIQDPIIKSTLGIKDFTDANEILKYF